MILSQRKRKQWIIIFIILEIFLFVFILSSLAREYWHTRSIRAERNQLESRVAQLIQEREELSGLIQEFASPQFQERIARTKLGLAYPEEKVYVIRGEIKDGLKVAAQESQEALISPPQLWWRYFFGVR